MPVSPEKNRFDIREHKKQLRAKFKQLRIDMTDEVKQKLDENIAKRFLSLKIYKECKTLLSYVSTAIEVDTMQIISAALADGKKVAVPKCVDGTRDMIFYVIKSTDDLEPGAFSVLEPVPERCDELTEFDGAVCIVPALAYDMDGFRLGYGKGYYDRFLSAHKGLYNVGVEYCCCTVPKLIRGRFDIAAQMLVTEKYTKKLS